MAIDKAKQNARWRRNKADQRKRERARRPQPPPISPEFEKQVWAERDRRLRNFPWDMPRAADGSYYRRRTREETYPLICDVWAVQTLLESQNFHPRISDGMIAEVLWDMGKTYGLKLSSLRTRVWLAREIICHLETAPARSFQGPYWPKFPLSVDEHGTGLLQHMRIALRNAGIE